MDKAYTLRDMNADDLFVVLKIINKIGVKEVKNCFSAVEMKENLQAVASAGGDENNEYVAAVGLNVMMSIAGLVVERLPECKTEIYQFLSSLSGMKVDEVAAMPMADFFGMVMDVFKHPSFNDFFQRVVGLFK